MSGPGWKRKPYPYKRKFKYVGFIDSVYRGDRHGGHHMLADIRFWQIDGRKRYPLEMTATVKMASIEGVSLATSKPKDYEWRYVIISGPPARIRLKPYTPPSRNQQKRIERMALRWERLIAGDEISRPRIEAEYAKALE